MQSYVILKICRNLQKMGGVIQVYFPKWGEREQMKKGKILKNIFIIYITILILIISSYPIQVKADTASPVSYAVIKLNGIEDRECYYTLLAETKVDESDVKYRQTQEETRKKYGEELWNVFSSYKDADGYYFMNDFRRVNGDEVKWEWPYKKFKVLIYFPNSRTYVVSNVCDDYAYDSYYEIDMNNIDLGSDSTVNVDAHRNYNYFREGVQLFIRIIATLLIEMMIAFLFGFREKRQIFIILAANIVTQVALNIYLNIFTYREGAWLYTLIPLFLGEIVVFILESVLYSLFLNRVATEKKKVGAAVISAIAYAFLANVVSFLFSGIYVMTGSGK